MVQINVLNFWYPSYRNAVFSLLFVILLHIPNYRAFAQAHDSLPVAAWSKTQVFVHFQWTAPFLFSGQELMRSAALRTQGKSYFAVPSGSSRSVGEYSPLSGSTIGFGFLSPIPALPGLMLGATLHNSQTGSQPSEGDYAEGYFFNFLLGAVSARYYIATAPVFVQGEFGLASVLTKNRYVVPSGGQEFFHQFGIGSGMSASLGYSFNPFPLSSVGIDILASYQFMNTRVEVNGIGDDAWTFGAVGVGAAIHW